MKKQNSSTSKKKKKEIADGKVVIAIAVNVGKKPVAAFTENLPVVVGGPAVAPAREVAPVEEALEAFLRAERVGRRLREAEGREDRTDRRRPLRVPGLDGVSGSLG